MKKKAALCTLDTNVYHFKELLSIAGLLQYQDSIYQRKEFGSLLNKLEPVAVKCPQCSGSIKLDRSPKYQLTSQFYVAFPQRCTKHVESQ